MTIPCPSSSSRRRERQRRRGTDMARSPGPLSILLRWYCFSSVPLPREVKE
jgi:hypothetical protein